VFESKLPRLRRCVAPHGSRGTLPPMPDEARTATSKLVPWANGSPTLLHIPGSEHFYLPCFSSEAGLRAAMQSASLPYSSVKRIDDGREFLCSIPPSLSGHSVRIVIDLRFLPDGRTRFLEVGRG
jgi:hypothetical protein